MLERPLGMTGLKVSQIGLGTWPLAGNEGLAGYGRVVVEQAEATIEAALEAGIFLFETGSVYGCGLAEQLLGRALHGRADAIVVTKGGFSKFSQGQAIEAQELLKEFHLSRERLQRETIDVYLLHNPPPHLIGLRESYRPLLRLRERGLVRKIGVAVAQPSHAWLALDRPEVEVIQIPFNVLQSEAEFGLLERASSLGKGILARETLLNGLLAGRYNRLTRFPGDDFRAEIPATTRNAVFDAMDGLEPFRRPNESWVDFALRFVLDRPEISCAVVGARRAEQIQALARAGQLSSSPLRHQSIGAASAIDPSMEV